MEKIRDLCISLIIFTLLQIFYPILIIDPLSIFGFKVANNQAFRIECFDENSGENIQNFSFRHLGHYGEKTKSESGGLCRILLGTSDGRYVVYRFSFKEVYRYFGSVTILVSAPNYQDKEMIVPFKWIWIGQETKLKINLGKLVHTDKYAVQ